MNMNGRAAYINNNGIVWVESNSGMVYWADLENGTRAIIDGCPIANDWEVRVNNVLVATVETLDLAFSAVTA